MLYVNVTRSSIVTSLAGSYSCSPASIPCVHIDVMPVLLLTAVLKALSVWMQLSVF